MRLVSVYGSADNESYSYDANGNRLGQTVNGGVQSASYGSASNQLTNTSGSGAVSYAYDGRGNLTTVDSVAAFQYNPFNRLVQAGSSTYYVNPEGQRLEKVVSGAATYFAPDASGSLLAEDDSGVWVDYLWLNGRLIGRISQGQVQAIHDDQLGRPATVTNASQAVVWQAQNLAFTCNVTASNGVTLNLGFPGQYYDQESGLWNNGFRDYDALMGRYVESDPSGLAGGINTYAYVADNPLNYADLFGLKLCHTSLPGKPDAYIDSDFLPSVSNWLSDDSADGIDVTVTSAFRTSASQANPGSNWTTPAPSGGSLHEAGWAVDISMHSLTASQQATVIANAAANGISWGGNFHSPDPVHFYIDPGNRSQLIKQAQEDYSNGTAENCQCSN